MECCKWCMRYHQTERKKNDHRLTVLKKVVDKYDYSDMSFPASYEDIEKFEEINQVCIFVYELDDTAQKTFRKSKQGNIDYLQKDCIYLLLIEHEEHRAFYEYKP